MAIAKFKSLKLWGSLYFLTYGIFIEAGSLPPEASRFLGWIFYPYCLSMVVLGPLLAWKLASLARFRLMTVCLLIPLVPAFTLGIYYLPNFVPFYYGHLRYDWSEDFNQALQSICKLSLLVTGTWLFVAFVRDSSIVGDAAKGDLPPAGVPHKGVKKSSGAQAAPE